MKTLHLITVGKLKEKSYLDLENNYYKRLSSFNVIIHEQKSHRENLEFEAKDVIKKVDDIKKKGPAPIILLTEKGFKGDSHHFSSWLYDLFKANSKIILIIGGASGHGQELYDIADSEISLSPLTFPHHMVRVILAEQLYRAETIHHGHPYSK